MGKIHTLPDKAVKEINATCPGVNLYYLDFLAGTWRQQDRGKKKTQISTKERLIHATKTAECAESLSGLLRDERFRLSKIHITNAIQPIDLKLVFWTLKKISDEANQFKAMYEQSDGRKRLSKMSEIICNIANLIERAGGVVDSRPNGQLIKIIGIIAEVAGQTPPDRSTVRDVLKGGHAAYEAEYWDKVLDQGIFKGDE